MSDEDKKVSLNRKTIKTSGDISGMPLTDKKNPIAGDNNIEDMIPTDLKTQTPPVETITEQPSEKEEPKEEKSTVDKPEKVEVEEPTKEEPAEVPAPKVEQPKAEEVKEDKPKKEETLEKEDDSVGEDASKPKPEKTEIGENPPEPSDDEVEEEESDTMRLSEFISQAAGPEENVSDYIKEVAGSTEQIAETFEKIDKETPDDTLKEQMQDTETYPSQLYLANLEKDKNKQSSLISYLLDELKKSHRKLEHSTGDLSDKISHGKKGKKADGNLVVTGPRATTAVLARLKGLKRIYLFNSGFYIDIRPLDLNELNSFYNSVDQEYHELGKIMGGHLYMFDDVHIKQKFAELIPLMTQASNLSNWQKGNTLIKNISYHDLDTVIWGACTLQFRKGIEIGLVCANTECRHVDHSVNVDLNKLRYNVFDNIPEEAIEFVINSQSVNSKSLEKYRTTIMSQRRSCKDEMNGITNEYVFQVPTLYEWLQEGRELLGKIAGVVNGETSLRNQKVRQQYMINTYRMFKPWITELKQYEDGEQVLATYEREAIMTALDISQQESGSLRDNLVDYIRDTKITYICYTALKCRKCGTTPNTTVDDYVPLDVQQVFFYLACRRIVLAGIH